MRRDRDEWGDGPDEERTPVEWEVWGTVEGVATQRYERGVEAEDAAEAFREFFESEGCVVEIYEVTLSEWQS